jgi:hypothetical protein
MLIRVFAWYRYKSQATFERHFAAPEFAACKETLRAENILVFDDPAAAEIRFVEHIAGFM